MATKSNGNHPASAGAAIYVDTENLREPDLAQDVIAQTVADWPAEYPPVGSLSLYVRADKVALWRMWLEATYPELARRVRGVQHFSREMAKNSADLAITADAIGDLAAGQAGYIAVISNDSDFGALFVKVREMALDAGWERLPFLWITAPGGGAISPEIERFIPDRFRWNLPNASRPNPVPTWTQTPARPPAVTRKPSAQAPAAQAPAAQAPAAQAPAAQAPAAQAPAAQAPAAQAAPGSGRPGSGRPGGSLNRADSGSGDCSDTGGYSESEFISNAVSDAIGGHSYRPQSPTDRRNPGCQRRRYR